MASDELACVCVASKLALVQNLWLIYKPVNLQHNTKWVSQLERYHNEIVANCITRLSLASAQNSG